MASSSTTGILLPFSMTDLCRLRSSSLTYIKNKYREEVRDVDQELIHPCQNRVGVCIIPGSGFPLVPSRIYSPSLAQWFSVI